MLGGAKVTVNRSNTRAYRETAQKLPTLMRNGMKTLVRRERAEIRKEVAVEVRPPEHPFRWSTEPEQQKSAARWWFRRVKLGLVATANGRYIRSGSILKGWKLESNIDDLDGLITLGNVAPGSEYVVGDKQVPSHAKSGHPQIAKVAMRSSKRMNAKARVLFRTIARPQQRTA